MNSKNVTKKILPELLAPCGSREAIEAAIEGGADAVYFGGTMLNARMNAKNFGREELVSSIAECHSAGVKAYITLNTQVYDRELKSALEYVGFLQNADADALIIADLGLSRLIRKYYPDIELHASTQMTVHNTEGANTLYDCGFSRVVGARELSRDNIVSLCKNSKPEIELFVHGAICVSCSGQCLMSAMLGGRSGNRGECAQPCRMSYNGGYPISLKDMCLAGHIPFLIDSGVRSLKIEGRMKSPSYVYGVTKIYRKLLDEGRAADGREISELAKIFSRGGFTDGYFTKKISTDMLGVRSGKDISETKGISVFHSSGKERTPDLIVKEKNRTLELPNKLDFPPKTQPKKPITTARFRSASQIPDSHFLKHVYLPLSKYENIADGVILPPVIFDSELYGIKKKLSFAVSKGAKHIMLSNIGQLSLAKEFGLVPHGDFRFNAFNAFTADYISELGELESLILSCELTLPQIRDIHFTKNTLKGVVAYGRLPLMLLEKPVGRNVLKDTRGASFPILSEDERDILYNSVPVYMGDQTDRLDGVGVEERHMIFSDENKGDVMKVLYAYAHKVIPKESIRRIK